METNTKNRQTDFIKYTLFERTYIRFTVFYQPNNYNYNYMDRTDGYKEDIRCLNLCLET